MTSTAIQAAATFKALNSSCLCNKQTSTRNLARTVFVVSGNFHKGTKKQSSNCYYLQNLAFRHYPLEISKFLF